MSTLSSHSPQTFVFMNFTSGYSNSLCSATQAPHIDPVYTLRLWVPVQFEQPPVLISNALSLYFSVADIDECASDSHQCNPTQICINTEGGYTCSCTEGYWLLEGQCLGKNLRFIRFAYLHLFVCLWIAGIISLSIFVKYRVKALATQKLMSFIFTIANSTLAERLPHGTKM